MATLASRSQASASPTEKDDAFHRVALRNVMLGNGVLMIFMALVGGLGLWMYLLGGIFPLPGIDWKFQLPGSAEGWASEDSELEARQWCRRPIAPSPRRSHEGDCLE